MKCQLFLLAGLSAGLWGTAAAQSASPVKLTLDQDLIRTVQKDGKAAEERVSAPSSVLPGAVLIEEVTAQNVSGKVLNKIRVGVPIPQGTQFLGSVTPSNDRWTTQFTAACAGKALAYAEAPLKCTETVEGKSVTREIKSSEYTNVRWLLDTLKPDETLKLSFRVKVN
ncbi:hypothetical protein EHF33_01210 [Deinococcus psychrotolerans]|uniref:DUF11 domain-containing protein n=1 Tax=Deinococcus psychrotolerans TaxID=2489213 RepID=A0A3G8Y839_9DEIO|nr:hypothetical protein [Deinococcus psychrotolerans]AZI41542.1 hypothetical protein EHF33_01210 [Deinococcus psychrotolerans]